MVGMVQSLNGSVAAALILSEALKQRQQAGLIGSNPIDQNTYQKLFFEWCYPDLAKRCQAKGIPYPAIDDDGNFVDPSGFSEVFNRHAK